MYIHNFIFSYTIPAMYIWEIIKIETSSCGVKAKKPARERPASNDLTMIVSRVRIRTKETRRENTEKKTQNKIKSTL